jgi:hypothetical protein
MVMRGMIVHQFAYFLVMFMSAAARLTRARIDMHRRMLMCTICTVALRRMSARGFVVVIMMIVDFMLRVSSQLVAAATVSSMDMDMLMTVDNAYFFMAMNAAVAAVRVGLMAVPFVIVCSCRFK